MTNRRVSLQDVAKLAGVSSNTVSRVVRGDPEVSDTTRRKIRRLLDELDYKPNIAARVLSSNQTGMVHILLAAPIYHGHASMLLEMMDALALAGFCVSISSANRGENKIYLHRDLIPIYADAVIIVGGHGSAVEVAEKLGERMPTVLVLTGDHDLKNVSTVSVDNALGARLATQHLLSFGLSDLVHIAGPDDWFDAVERRRGYTEACVAADVRPVVVSAGSWDAEGGYELTRQNRSVPQALFAANDQLAMGAMRALLEKKVRVPEQVRIIGFDDIVGAQSVFPPLSTIRQPFGDMGRTAVAHLRSLMAGKPSVDTLIEPTLIVRGSSGELSQDKAD